MTTDPPPAPRPPTVAELEAERLHWPIRRTPAQPAWDDTPATITARRRALTEGDA